MTTVGYILSYSDGEYDTILPPIDMLPRILYTSVDAAEDALKRWATEFQKYRPVLYGDAYPFDKTSARKELEKEGKALYGWAILEDDDGAADTYGLCILAVRGA